MDTTQQYASKGETPVCTVGLHPLTDLLLGIANLLYYSQFVVYPVYYLATLLPLSCLHSPSPHPFSTCYHCYPSQTSPPALVWLCLCSLVPLRYTLCFPLDVFLEHIDFFLVPADLGLLAALPFNCYCAGLVVALLQVLTVSGDCS